MTQGAKANRRHGRNGRRRAPRHDTDPGRAQAPATVAITGGAGFIGTNLADRLLDAGRRVRLIDTLSRPGVERNADWLQQRHGSQVKLDVVDVRNAAGLRSAVRDAAAVFHLAAQVAVTTSLADPVHDFEVNAWGTLNLLEAIRACPSPPTLLFTSTNKVYGELSQLDLVRHPQRYEPRDDEVRRTGVPSRMLNFHSPYGCSKGTADQYVLDYARTYHLPTTVFRMSCIYGPHQFGTEDQGWVAHFLISALQGKPITLYGDGRQVRDVLFVDDLVAAMRRAVERIDHVRGKAFNVGGGPRHTLSLLELVDLIEALTGRAPQVRFDEWRPGDQKYYVSDIRGLAEALDWQPRIGVRDGVTRLHRWLVEHHAVTTPGGTSTGSARTTA